MTRNSGKIKAKIETRYSRWIRKYIDSIHDPKVVSLTDHQYRAWDILLLVAGRAPDGILPPIRDIACDLRCNIVHAQSLLDDLINAGLIDIVGRAGDIVQLRPHNWEQRQFKWDGSDPTNSERQQRYRNRRNGQSNGRVTETASDSVYVSSVNAYQDSKNGTYQTHEDRNAFDDEVL